MRRILLALLILSVLLGMIPAQATIYSVRALVLMVNFSNDTIQPYTATTAAGVMFNDLNSVRQFWLDASNGNLQITGDIRGWYTIPDDNLDCDTGNWETLARSAATADGVDLSQYTHFIYGYARAPACPWRAVAGGNINSGAVSLGGGFSQQLLIHEFGHALGLSHTASMPYPGGPVSEGGVPYSFFFSGSQWLPSGAEREKVGFFTPSAVVSASGIYVLPALHLGGTLKVPRPDGSVLYLDYRQDDLWADYPLNGITVSYRHQNSAVAYVIGTPCGSAVIRTGESWYDAVARITVRVESRTATEAIVTVTLNSDPPILDPDVTAPSVPTNLQGKKARRNVNLWWSGSSDDRDCSVRYYRVYRNGNLIGTSDGAAFTDVAVPRRTTLTYRVSASDSAGNESAKSTALTIGT